MVSTLLWPHQLLDGADAVALLQQVGGEGVTEGVGGEPRSTVKLLQDGADLGEGEDQRQADGAPCPGVPPGGVVT
jgi:hypothetical protein